MAQRNQPGEAEHQGVGGAFELPARRSGARRLAAVLHVLYLMFNEGYTSSGRSCMRVDLSGKRCGW